MIREKTFRGPRKPQIAVEIEGREVRLIVMCSDHYSAIEMYEDLVASCRDGKLILFMEVRPCAEETKMLDDPKARAAFAKKNVRDSLPPRRPSDFDGHLNDELNSLDAKFFRSDKVRLELHVLPWRHGLEELEFLAKHINGLIAQVRREATDRSKSLLIRDTLKHWSQGFARRGK